MSLTERTDPMTSPRSFKEWMAAVNEARVRKVGVCSSDLPNFTYRDLYDQGVTPEEAADYAIENAAAVDRGSNPLRRPPVSFGASACRGLFRCSRPTAGLYSPS
jgi:hypothetical protein